MKTIYKILIVCFITLSCTSNDDKNGLKSFCSVDNPIVDLPWLKAEIDQREQNIDESSKYYYVSQAIHEEEEVFIYANCDPIVNSVFPVFNCLGENIGFIGDGVLTDETLSSGNIIWKTDKFACEF